jgi:hypothetical protein
MYLNLRVPGQHQVHKKHQKNRVLCPLLCPNGLLIADKGLQKNIDTLKDYLKSNLTLVEVKGAYSYYSCGHDYHRHSDLGWKPFKNLEEFCEMKGFDPYEVRDLIENHLGKKLVCECQIVNAEEAIRRARLRRSFGLDFGEPGNETCELVDD